MHVKEFQCFYLTQTFCRPVWIPAASARRSACWTDWCIAVQGTLLLACDGRLSWQGQLPVVEHRWRVLHVKWRHSRRCRSPAWPQRTSASTPVRTLAFNYFCDNSVTIALVHTSLHHTACGTHPSSIKSLCFSILPHMHAITSLHSGTLTNLETMSVAGNLYNPCLR